MPDYRRLISYIYEYEGEEKGKNVGFVKLEARNGQCRIHVNIKQMYVGGNAVGVYLLGKSGEQTCLGNMFVRGGSGEFRATVDARNVDGTGNSLDAYYGLSVHEVKSAWRTYITIWEDCEKTIETQSAETDRKEIEQEKESASGYLRTAELTEAALGEANSERTNSATDVGMGIMAQDILPGSADVRAKELAQSESDSDSVSADSGDELGNPDILRQLQELEDFTDDPERLWEELRKMYPKIQPFSYDGESEVLTIRPQDIGRLPRESWVYGNNSFLLHGYYNFRYIILMRLKQEDGKTRYLLGVPGHYYSSEKYMATMFGFPNFVLSKKQPPNDDRFGYWYTDIKMRSAGAQSTE